MTFPLSTQNRENTDRVVTERDGDLHPDPASSRITPVTLYDHLGNLVDPASSTATNLLLQQLIAAIGDNTTELQRIRVGIGLWVNVDLIHVGLND